MGVSSSFVSAAIGGVGLHWVVYRKAYIDKNALRTTIMHLSILSLTSYLSGTNSKMSMPFRVGLSVAMAFTSAAAVFASMLIYRAFFHPLHAFPGPFAAKLSKFWALYMAIITERRSYRLVPELQRKYGDYIRTGPRELTICDPAAIPHVLGFSSNAFKGPWYDAMGKSIAHTRDRDFHKQRRKIYDSAIRQLLVTYPPTIEEFTAELLQRIELNEQKPIMAKDMAFDYAYDVMNQLVFGKPGGFVKGQASDQAKVVSNAIKNGTSMMGYLYNLPWLMNILINIGRKIGPMKGLNEWSEQQLRNRIASGSKKPDLMGHVIANTPTDTEGKALLFSDARSFIGAGSETVATTLTEILMLLVFHPEYVQKLRDEIDPIFKSGGFSCQVSYPFLEAVINETLRLYPPVLFPSSREIPREGLQVGEIYIPPYTVVSMPVWQLHRDPRNFVDPDKFIPERWTSRPELVINRAAYMPFLTGPVNCPGKPLAMMEIRSCLSHIVHLYDFTFPDGVVVEERDYFATVRDHFVAVCPEQELVFSRRVTD